MPGTLIVTIHRTGRRPRRHGRDLGQALTDMQGHAANGGGAAGANPANMHTDVTTSGL